MYFVDRSLRAISLTRLYSDDRFLADLPWRPERDAPPADGQPPLPISPDGQLVAGRLYESSADPSARLYLPQYQLHAVAGEYQSSLRWTATPDAPAGPIGLLTIDLAAQTPSAPGFALAEIAHTAVARLRYRQPIEGQAAGPAAEGLPPFAYELGALNEVAPGVRRCQLAIYERADFDRIYRIMTEERYGGLLELRCFATVGHRTWRQVPAPRGPRAVLAAQAASSVGLGQISKAEQIARARVGRAAAPILGGAAPAAEAEVYELRPAHLPELLGDAGATLGGGVPAALTGIAARVDLAGPARLIERAPAARLDPAILMPRDLPAAPIERAPARPINTAILVAADREAAQAVAAPVRDLLLRSDMRVRKGGEELAAIPVGALVDRRGEPALLAIAIEAGQVVQPFCFLPATSGAMFQLPGGFAPAGRDSLLPDAYTHSDGRVVRYYRDEGKGLFYYQPSEFLLARTARASAGASYQPYLLATMQEIITTGAGQGDAVTDASITLTYQVLPALDPELRELMAADIERKYGEPPRLLPLAPVAATVSFDDLPGVPPQQLQADFVSGIAGEIELSEEQFKQVMALLTARPDKPAGSLGGTVSAHLLDSTPVEVPLRISLKETAGPLFEAAILGPADGADQWRVQLTNRVESPVTISALRQVSVGASSVAYPQPFAPATLRPGQSATVTYQVAPAGGPLRAIDPQVVASVQIDDFKALWRRLVLKQGFTDETFAIAVVMAGPEYFASSPGGGAMLTKITVDFDCGARAELTAQAQSAAVTLERGYLATLIGDFSTYRYRLSCAYDSGATAEGDWVATDMSELPVVPLLPGAGG